MSDVIVRFDNVSFEWGINKPILDGVSFTIRRGMKLTLMGQNGAGKSTIFGLIAGLHTPESGIINIVKGVSIATSRQVIPPNEMNLTVREFFISFAKATAGPGKKENMKNAQLQKEIQAKKDQANVFAYKGGRLRLVAKRMREKAEELEEEIVDVRKEDKSIRPFNIPSQPDLIGEILHISSFETLKNGKKVKHKAKISLNKNMHLLLQGPNGIGKTTLLERLASGHAAGEKVKEGIRIGYYRQDFSTLNFEDTVYQSLSSAMLAGGEKLDEERMRSVAAGFLITGEFIRTKIGDLSEGQKGLVAFARLVLLKPGLLILDEPTNHINFHHLPIIAKALDEYD